MSELPDSLRIAPIEADITAGTCNSPTKCMYAMALRRMFPRATYVSVNPHCVTITFDGVYYHYIIPRKAVKSILLYDDEKHIDVKKTAVTMTLAGKKHSSYVGTEEVKRLHRLRSARHRSQPGYIRPENRDTLRKQLAKARLVQSEG